MWLERWHKRQASLKASLKKSYLFRIWGRRLFTHVLWRTDKRSIAGGLALGLFLAFTPTIPFQMVLAVAGGLYFHVNLPIALAACWVTNPLTAVPIYAAAWRLGQYVADSAVPVEELLEAYRITGRTGAIVRQGFYLWTGSLIFSLTSALTANVVVRIIWRVTQTVHERRKRKQRCYAVTGQRRSGATPDKRPPSQVPSVECCQGPHRR